MVSAGIPPLSESVRVNSTTRPRGVCSQPEASSHGFSPDSDHTQPMDYAGDGGAAGGGGPGDGSPQWVTMKKPIISQTWGPDGRHPGPPSPKGRLHLMLSMSHTDTATQQAPPGTSMPPPTFLATSFPNFLLCSAPRDMPAGTSLAPCKNIMPPQQATGAESETQILPSSLIQDAKLQTPFNYASPEKVTGGILVGLGLEKPALFGESAEAETEPCYSPLPPHLLKEGWGNEPPRYSNGLEGEGNGRGGGGGGEGGGGGGGGGGGVGGEGGICPAISPPNVGTSMSGAENEDRRKEEKAKRREMREVSKAVGLSVTAAEATAVMDGVAPGLAVDMTAVTEMTVRLRRERVELGLDDFLVGEGGGGDEEEGEKEEEEEEGEGEKWMDGLDETSMVSVYLDVGLSIPAGLEGGAVEGDKGRVAAEAEGGHRRGPSADVEATRIADVAVEKFADMAVERDADVAGERPPNVAVTKIADVAVARSADVAVARMAVVALERGADVAGRSAEESLVMVECTPIPEHRREEWLDGVVEGSSIGSFRTPLADTLIEPQPEPEPQPQSGFEPEPEPQPQPGSEAVPEPGSEQIPGPEPRPAQKPAVEPVFETGSIRVGDPLGGGEVDRSLAQSDEWDIGTEEALPRPYKPRPLYNGYQGETEEQLPPPAKHIPPLPITTPVSHILSTPNPPNIGPNHKSMEAPSLNDDHRMKTWGGGVRRTIMPSLRPYSTPIPAPPTRIPTPTPTPTPAACLPPVDRGGIAKVNANERGDVGVDSDRNLSETNVGEEDVVRRSAENEKEKMTGAKRRREEGGAAENGKEDMTGGKRRREVGSRVVLALPASGMGMGRAELRGGRLGRKGLGVGVGKETVTPPVAKGGAANRGDGIRSHAGIRRGTRCVERGEEQEGDVDGMTKKRGRPRLVTAEGGGGGVTNVAEGGGRGKRNGAGRGKGAGGAGKEKKGVGKGGSGGNMMTRAQKIRAEKVRADPKVIDPRADKKVVKTREQQKSSKLQGKGGNGEKWGKGGKEGEGGMEGSDLFEGLHFVLTGIDKEVRVEVLRVVEENGGGVWGDVPRPDGGDDRWESNPPIIVAGRQSRTLKYLFACAVGLPPVTPQWIHACVRAKKVVALTRYFLPEFRSVAFDKGCPMVRVGENYACLEEGDRPMRRRQVVIRGSAGFQGWIRCLVQAVIKVQRCRETGGGDDVSDSCPPVGGMLSQHGGGEVVKSVGDGTRKGSATSSPPVIILEAGVHLPPGMQRVVDRTGVHVLSQEWVVNGLLSGQFSDPPLKNIPAAPVCGQKEKKERKRRRVEVESEIEDTPQEVSSAELEGSEKEKDTEKSISADEAVPPVVLPSQRGSQTRAKSQPRARSTANCPAGTQTEGWEFVGMAYPSAQSAARAAQSPAISRKFPVSPAQFPGRKKRGMGNRMDPIFYAVARRGDIIVRVGDDVELRPPTASIAPYVARLEALWEEESGGGERGTRQVARCRWFYRPEDTPFPCAAGERPNVYRSDHCDDGVELGSIIRIVTIQIAPPTPPPPSPVTNKRNPNKAFKRLLDSEDIVEGAEGGGEGISTPTKARANEADYLCCFLYAHEEELLRAVKPGLVL